MEGAGTFIAALAFESHVAADGQAVEAPFDPEAKTRRDPRAHEKPIGMHAEVQEPGHDKVAELVQTDGDGQDDREDQQVAFETRDGIETGRKGPGEHKCDGNEAEQTLALRRQRGEGPGGPGGADHARAHRILRPGPPCE